MRVGPVRLPRTQGRGEGTTGKWGPVGKWEPQALLGRIWGQGCVSSAPRAWCMLGVQQVVVR